MVNKSKIQKAALWCACLTFMGFLCYDFYTNKNSADINNPPLAVNENNTLENSDLKNNNLKKVKKKVKQKKNKSKKAMRKGKTYKKSGKKKVKPTKPININTATVSELCNGLKGIGAAKAKLIVLYRNKMGKFLNIAEIKNIRVIGEKTFRNLADSITV